MKILFIIYFSLLVNSAVYARGECCLSKFLTNATTTDIALAKNIGLSLQYEYSNMETILEGSNSVSPNTVLDRTTSETGYHAIGNEEFFCPYQDDYAEIYLFGCIPYHASISFSSQYSLCYKRHVHEESNKKHYGYGYEDGHEDGYR